MSPRSRPLRVLIVEDEVLLAMELEYLVSEAGLEIVGHAVSHAEAVRILREMSPDLALIDIHLLDGPTGIEVARVAVQETNALVLFMTANRARIPADFAGACGAIGKPYTEAGMVAALRFIEGKLCDEVSVVPLPPSVELAPDWAAYWTGDASKAH